MKRFTLCLAALCAAPAAMAAAGQTSPVIAPEPADSATFMQTTLLLSMAFVAINVLGGRVLLGVLLRPLVRRVLRPAYDRAATVIIRSIERGPISGGLLPDLAFAGVTVLALQAFWGAGW